MGGMASEDGFDGDDGAVKVTFALQAHHLIELSVRHLVSLGPPDLELASQSARAAALWVRPAPPTSSVSNATAAKRARPPSRSRGPTLRRQSSSPATRCSSPD